MLYAVSYQNNERILLIVTNVMISLAFVQLLIIMLYHFITYTFHCGVADVAQILKIKFTILRSKMYFKSETDFDAELLNVPDCTFNYTKYQDGLVSDDFVQNENAM